MPSTCGESWGTTNTPRLMLDWDNRLGISLALIAVGSMMVEPQGLELLLMHDTFRHST